MTDHPDLVRWLHPSLHIHESPIDRIGLFTKEPLDAGTLVVRFGGYVFSSSARYDYSRVAKDTIVGISEEAILAEPSGGRPDYSDKINHSCDPNLGMLDAISLVTVRSVPAGSELTCDYAYWEVDPDYVMNARCNCRTASCREQVTGSDWMRADIAGRIRRWAAPFIRRRLVTESGNQTNMSEDSRSER
jgi:hypothetical protein